jgi:phage protein U
VAFTRSYLDYGHVPSAVITDGIVPIPLWSVTTMTLTETYALPPIGSTTSKASVGVHDDTVALSGVLVGGERYAWKLLLETLAESSKRGSALASFTGGKVGGLILVTSMTIRTDMQVQSLVFGATAAKRDTLDVTITMAYMPLPGSLGKLLDVASVGIGALADGLEQFT